MRYILPLLVLLLQACGSCDCADGEYCSAFENDAGFFSADRTCLPLPEGVTTCEQLLALPEFGSGTCREKNDGTLVHRFGA